MLRICVFCGSRMGASSRYREVARDFGTLLAELGLGLVYGGGNVGLMGILADAALAAGGAVWGVIPRSLADREVAHAGLTDLAVVGSMHERKARMADLSHAFVALPGGLGTLDELFEIWTWRQLGFHGKPIGLLNVAGYFDPLLAFLDRMVEEGFVHFADRDAVLVDEDAGRLLDRLLAGEPLSETGP